MGEGDHAGLEARGRQEDALLAHLLVEGGEQLLVALFGGGEVHHFLLAEVGAEHGGDGGYLDGHALGAEDGAQFAGKGGHAAFEGIVVHLAQLAQGGQTGGHGQFGDVVINFEPCDSEQVVFEEKVFGGSVPKNFFPAVEKGVRLAAEKGVLAGYPVVGLKATLLDGSYHPVDSSEMAFIMAAKLAYKAAMPEAGPVILEPIHTLKAHVPNDNTGDIMGDVTKRRGRVLGMEPDEDGMQTVIAEVPLAELSNFTTFIRQITQGRGWFTTEFARYEILPEMLVPAVVEQAKKLGNLDEGAED